MPVLDFDHTLDLYHLALGEFVKGNPESCKELYSHRADVTLANPFGPPVSGWKAAAETMERAARNYRDGEVTGFENVATYVTPELAYIVEIERYKARIGGASDKVPVVLRVTSIYRPEDGAWKIVHRHADTIVSARPADSVIS